MRFTGIIVFGLVLFLVKSLNAQDFEIFNGMDEPEIRFIQDDTLILVYNIGNNLIFYPGGRENGEIVDGFIGLFNSSEWGPFNNGTMTLGSSDFRWSEIWSTNGLNMTSDIRLKKNISRLGYGLSTIRKMRPISFNCKEGRPLKRLGFSAQEMQKVVPEIVQHHIMTQEEIDKAVRSGRKGFEEESYSIDYIGLIPVLVNSISELADQVDELKKTDRISGETYELVNITLKCNINFYFWKAKLAYNTLRIRNTSQSFSAPDATEPLY